MAHLIFIAKGRDVGMYRLTGRERSARGVTLGRDVQCDIFVPDVFVSRLHCRLEPTDEGEWAVVDARSRNGIHYNGHPVYRRVLRHGDTIEIGSVAFQYDETDMPAGLSSPAPFGKGTSVASLVDTVYAQGMRAGEWIRRNQKKPVWELEREQAEEARLAEERAAAREAAELAERLDFSEPTELDLEIQVARAQAAGSGGAGMRPRYVLKLADWARDEEETPTAPAFGVLPGLLAPAGHEGAGDLGAAAVLEGLLPAEAGSLVAPSPQVGLPVSAASSAPASQYGRSRDLWSEAAAAAAAADEDAAAGRRQRKKPKKSVDDPAPVARKAPAAPRRSLGEFLSDLRAGYTVADLIEDLAARPMRSAGMGAALAAAVILATTLYLRRPTYKSPPRFNADGSLNRAYVQGPGD